jgi:glutamate racemase
LLENNRSLAPIGIFDSGVGGLSVLQHLRIALPGEDFLYVADSKYAPYGMRSAAAICQRSITIGDFLVERGVKLLVVACNTATAAAVTALRERYTLPVVAMEPGIKPAAEQTRSGVIGVLATAGTLESARFFSLVNRYAGSAEVITQPCAGLVECIEANDLDSAATITLLQSYLDPLLARGADVIVLGCTHYPFLRAAIERLVGPGIAVVDTGAAVAREVSRRLQSDNLLRPVPRDSGESYRGSEQFWSSAEPVAVTAVIQQLWRPQAHVEQFIGAELDSASFS